MYTTSMGIVRSTFAKCQTIKKILRTLMVKFEERDVFMSHAHQDDIRKRMMVMTLQLSLLISFNIFNAFRPHTSMFLNYSSTVNTSE